MMNNIDLFSGIGGFSYVMHGKIRTIAYCDIDTNCRNTLKCIMSKGLIDTAHVFEDVKTLNASSFSETPHMITGGFPCQDISSANPNGAGLDGDRSSLFFEIIRLCDEIPSIRHVFLENVDRILKRGMIDRVEKEFHDRGFNVEYVIITAKQMGAPHRRRRCYILATKDVSELSHITLPWEDSWLSGPETMVPIPSPEYPREVRNRCGMCGNSVVPACVSAAFNHLVSRIPLPDQTRLLLGFRVSDGNVSYNRTSWGTPYACKGRYNRYLSITQRSRTVLYNQVYYDTRNEDKRDGNWTINPNFVEWLMGYPLDYTLNTLQ